MGYNDAVDAPDRAHMRAILTSPTGVRSQIGWLVETLIDYNNFENWHDARTTREIRRLGQKLEMAAGPMAPPMVLLALEPYVTRAYAQHVEDVWRLAEITEADIDPDEMPSLAISGEPPARSGRAAG
jgi:hypothetical protein